MVDELKDGKGRAAGSGVDPAKKSEVTRRKFLTVLGGAGVVAALGGGIADAIGKAQGLGYDIAYEVSGGYLLVDSMRCCSCQTCMMACSLAHNGVTNPGLARIQVVGDSFQHFPFDVMIEQCHQCKDPKCVSVCPTRACHVDKANGNVRTVDPAKCIGCMQCIEACPNSPSRMQWNFIDNHAQKCDQCYNTPYWDHEKGEAGTRACESVCPMGAIKFVTELPEAETGSEQYEVNLRDGTYWPSDMIMATQG